MYFVSRLGGCTPPSPPSCSSQGHSPGPKSHAALPAKFSFSLTAESKQTRGLRVPEKGLIGTLCSCSERLLPFLRLLIITALLSKKQPPETAPQHCCVLDRPVWYLSAGACRLAASACGEALGSTWQTRSNSRCSGQCL